MIELRISGDTAQEFAAQLATVAQLMAGAATAAPAAATTGRGKKSTAPADNGATTSDATASGASDQSDTSGPVTRESVATKCTQYGSPQKGGPAALKQLFTEFGSSNGKWSEVTDDKLVALNARLDDLLA